MDNQNNKFKAIKDRWKIFIWLGFLFFFVYSWQALIDLEPITNPDRHRAIIRILTSLFQPNLFDSENNYALVKEMLETLQISFLATSISAILAIPFTLLSARATSFWGRVFYIVLQPILAGVRAIHPINTFVLVLTLASVGPTAGVLALILFSSAVLIGKFTEYAQQHDNLTWKTLVSVYFPVIALRYFPANMVIATIVGYFGGGGIGLFLQQTISLLNYADASVAIVAVIIVIGSLDLLIQFISHKILQAEIYPNYV